MIKKLENRAEKSHVMEKDQFFNTRNLKRFRHENGIDDHTRVKMN